MSELSGATQTYVILYLGTLVIHVVFMSYVLAGSGVVLLSAVLRDGRRGGLEPIAAMLRDWLPFALGVAITAGVAPLLFVQILYEHSFYTANLLLFLRWLAVVPVVMAGFYLLYLGKARPFGDRFRVLIAGGAFLCFAFTAYSWAENHLLSLDREAWPEIYAGGQMFYADSQLPVRVLMWMFGAAPVMACIVGWQLRRADQSEDTARPLAMVAVVGSIGAMAAALLLPIDRGHVLQVARPYVIGAAVGLVAQLGAWGSMAGRKNLSRAGLLGASLGLGVAIVCIAITRELLRLRALVTPSLIESHERSAEAGGTIAFAFFLVVNAVIIGWCIKTAQKPSSAESNSSGDTN